MARLRYQLIYGIHFKLDLLAGTPDKKSERMEQKSLFDINVFQYVSLLLIDFDIKFNVINFQTIPWSHHLWTAVSLWKQEARADDHPCFEEYTKPSLYINLDSKIHTIQVFLNCLIITVNSASGPIKMFLSINLHDLGMMIVIIFANWSFVAER